MDTEVLIIGAGLAGTALASLLKKKGISTIVLDRQAKYPDAFRAEKIESDQAEHMRKIGIFEYRMPKMEPLGKTINYRNGKRSEFNTVEQYGLHYGNFINNLRENILHDMDFRVSTVTRIDTSDSIQNVQLSDGSHISCRLVVIATGGMSDLIPGLKYSRKPHSSLRTYNVGFYIEPLEKGKFEFSGFNYFLDPPRDGIDYLTIFKIDDLMRVNLFTQLKRKDRLAVALKENTLDGINSYFPDLEKQLGNIEISSRVQFFFTDFYRLKNRGQDGVLVIADEYQSVCPATGTGLTKVCMDVDLAGNTYIPEWLQKKKVTAADLNRYYFDDRKWKCDQSSLYQWIYYRNSASGWALKQWSRLDTRLRSWFKLW